MNWSDLTEKAAGGKTKNNPFTFIVGCKLDGIEGPRSYSLKGENGEKVSLTP